jgi:NDP-sugar pyrophosphorylase family protein
MVFAAGLGTRLRPLTDSMPKALVPVGGKPLLWHVLRRLEASGYGDIVVNVHHFGEQIIDYLRGNEEFKGLNVSVSDERSALLDTGGGLLHAEPLLKGCGKFLVHNVDILSNADLDAMWQGARPDAIATLLVSDRPTSRYLLFDDKDLLVGWTNIKTGEVKTPFKGLRPEDCKKKAFAGIHVFSVGMLSLMPAWPDKFSIIDFYLKLCRSYQIEAVEFPSLQLKDLGTPAAVADFKNF